MKLKLKLMWLPDASFPLFDMQTNEVPSLSKEEQSFYVSNYLLILGSSHLLRNTLNGLMMKTIKFMIYIVS